MSQKSRRLLSSGISDLHNENHHLSMFPVLANALATLTPTGRSGCVKTTMDHTVLIKILQFLL
jgi:hypothetical protein